MAAGGDVGRLLDQDVLAVRERQARSAAMNGGQWEGLHQRDRSEGLDDLFPERFATQLGQKADESRPVRPGKLHHDRQTFRRVERVCVKEQEPLSPGELNGVVERVSLARPVRRQMIDGEDADARITLGDPACDFRGPVGAAVVDDQDFQVRIRLAANGAEAFGEVSLLVLGRKNRRRPVAGRVDYTAATLVKGLADGG